MLSNSLFDKLELQWSLVHNKEPHRSFLKLTFFLGAPRFSFVWVSWGAPSSLVSEICPGVASTLAALDSS